MVEQLYQDQDIEIRIEHQHSISDSNLLFFHKNDFVNRNSDDVLFFNYYYKSECLISIAFMIADQTAISLPKSPFGGLVIEENLNPEYIDHHLKTIVKCFRSKRYDIHIHQCPDSYFFSGGNFHQYFIQSGFEAQVTDINQHIVIGDDDFDTKTNRGRTSQLLSCIKNGFTFKELDKTFLTEAYDIIKECLDAKGFPITMNLDNLDDAFLHYPKQYILFGVFNEDKMIASATSVRVNSNILYNFFHGDRIDYRAYSPVTLLIDGIYSYCQKQEIKILDLGISSSGGVLNEGLHYFKHSCGAIDSNKITYIYKHK